MGFLFCKFSVIQNVIEHQPKPYYLLAVDSSNNTMEDIVKVCVATDPEIFCHRIETYPYDWDVNVIKPVKIMQWHLFLLQTVASVLGPGKIRKKPFEDAFLTQDLSVFFLFVGN